PTEEEFFGCILARVIPNIGNWKIFLSTDLKKLCKKDISIPNPEVSTYTTPNLNPTHLNWQNLIKELKLRGIETNNKENKNILVSNLEIQLEKDIKNARL
ncbi:4784_t:CDS:2, partial [Cetraspora pellucida]